LLFICWSALVAWLWWNHVFWRDEVRAFSLALSGSSFLEMLKNVHGEGHPALWYLILRAAHDVFPYREVLPIAGAVFGVAAMALVAFLSPFRLVAIALILFSAYGAFEYVVVARNYAIAALVMLGLAAMYGRVRNTLWLGTLLAILCNTNVPSCVLAAGFLLFRFIEILTDSSRPTRRSWLIFAGNVSISAAGAILCFLTVYPTVNDAAVSTNLINAGPVAIVAALLDGEKGFSHLMLPPVFLLVSCLAFVRKPAALGAAIFGFVILKLFFYFVYESFYRHEILYIFYLLSLFWITAERAGGAWPQKRWMAYAQPVGAWTFVVLLAAHTLALLAPVSEQLHGNPYSNSAEVAKLLQQPALSGAIVMADPDTLLEPLPYYVQNPLWMVREQRFGKVVRLTENARKELTLDDILADADRLHRQTGRPILFLSHVQLSPERRERAVVLFHDATTITPASIRRFLAATRHVSSLREVELSDENYDVYVYPR
jgi:hypothetical protein